MAGQISAVSPDWDHKVSASSKRRSVDELASNAVENDEDAGRSYVARS